MFLHCCRVYRCLLIFPDCSFTFLLLSAVSVWCSSSLRCNHGSLSCVQQRCFTWWVEGTDCCIGSEGSLLGVFSHFFFILTEPLCYCDKFCGSVITLIAEKTFWVLLATLRHSFLVIYCFLKCNSRCVFLWKLIVCDTVLVQPPPLCCVCMVLLVCEWLQNIIRKVRMHHICLNAFVRHFACIITGNILCS